MCREGGNPDDLRRAVDHLFRDLHPTLAFVLGLADNVPPNADFDRVRLISDLVSAAYPGE